MLLVVRWYNIYFMYRKHFTAEECSRVKMKLDWVSIYHMVVESTRGQHYCLRLYSWIKVVLQKRQNNLGRQI